MLVKSSVAALSGAAPVEMAEEAALTARQVHWVLRVGAAMCFIGHGAFGIITKPDWLRFFAVVGIPEPVAYALMPAVGVVDIAAGIAVLFAPMPAVLVWMTVWGFWTALLRPLAGDNVWETLERAGNYGVPLAFLVLAGGREALRDWLARITVRRPDEKTLAQVALVLRGSTALLLVGHGALGAFVEKPLLALHYEAIGLSASAVPLIGTIEIAAAVAVLLRPSWLLLALVALWKLATESLFLAAGDPIWEFIERGGSYAAPIALALILVHQVRGRAAGVVR